MDRATASHSSRGTIPIMVCAIGTPLSTIQVVFFVNATPGIVRPCNSVNKHRPGVWSERRIES